MTSSELRVRRASAADAPALARLRYEFRARRAATIEDEQSFVARCTSWIDERLTPAGPWLVWVLEAGDELIGTVWLQIIEKLPNPNRELERHAYLTSFFVRTEYRNQGAGARMLRVLLEECASRDIDAIFLWPSDESRTLYARHSFATASGMMILQR